MRLNLGFGVSRNKLQARISREAGLGWISISFPLISGSPCTSQSCWGIWRIYSNGFWFGLCLCKLSPLQGIVPFGKHEPSYRICTSWGCLLVNQNEMHCVCQGCFLSCFVDKRKQHFCLFEKKTDSNGMTQLYQLEHAAHQELHRRLLRASLDLMPATNFSRLMCSLHDILLSVLQQSSCLYSVGSVNQCKIPQRLILPLRSVVELVFISKDTCATTYLRCPSFASIITKDVCKQSLLGFSWKVSESRNCHCRAPSQLPNLGSVWSRGSNAQLR